MSDVPVYRWRDGALLPEPDEDIATPDIAVADSWLVVDGQSLALSLHRDRFESSLGDIRSRRLNFDGFWDATRALLPREGRWFPRVELRSAIELQPEHLAVRIRAAPAESRSVVVATLPGPDPRTMPLVKGPDLGRMADARAAVAALGADEAVLVTDEGYVIEGAYSGLLWWRGNILCFPLGAFDRIDSVTVRSVRALATALGIETYEEAVTPAELEGVELWAASALHGPRIVTGWIDGPQLAELPGRLASWRTRLGALRQPV